jgi:hypothetical protein
LGRPIIDALGQAPPCLCRVLHRIVTTVTSHHIVTAMTGSLLQQLAYALGAVVAFDTIVACVIDLFTLLTSSSVMCKEHLL